MTLPRGMKAAYRLKAAGHPMEKAIQLIIDLLPGIADFDNEAHMEALAYLREELGQIDISDYEEVVTKDVPNLNLRF